MIDDVLGDEATGQSTGTMPFRLWPTQVPVMWSLMRERLLIILKARQLGITWVVIGYILWLCLFHPGKVVLLFSKGQNEANEMLRRVKSLYRRLPDWLKGECPAPKSLDNKSALEFVNGSRIASLPATEGTGRSFTASVVVLDEAAWLRYGDELVDAAKPTIDAGGKLIMLSTANGVGGMFHSTWTKALEGVNGFATIFLPWWARPSRDGAWYARIQRESNDPKSIYQEYPANPTEAFLASGRSRFEAAWISNQYKYVEAARPLEPRSWPSEMYVSRGWSGVDRLRLPSIDSVPGLTVYKAPEPRRKYLIVGDVAEGLEDGDFDSAVVLDRDTREEVADLHGLWEPDEYAWYMMALSEPYNADVLVERNNHGHAVLATLKTARFPRVAVGHDSRPGWLTNEVTKPQGVDLLASNLRDDLVSVRTGATLREFGTFIRHRGGRLGAREGFHDDRVMKWVVALSYLRITDFKARGGSSSRGRSLVAGHRG